jgi:hypothetical protein
MWTDAVAQEPKVGSGCAGLALTLRVDIDRMRKLQDRARKEEKAPPPDLLSAWQRTFGKKGEGFRSFKELKKIRQHADDLNGTLRARGCATIDIDQALGVNRSDPKGP